jgi:putative membrane-bound dehydrogenase-like protein
VRVLIIVLAALSGSLLAQRPSTPLRAGPPYSPRDALKTFRLADSFQIELFAAEPLIADPVAMEVDEYGRTYVVEMPGYPLDVGGSGRVMLLRDSDGNGTPDRSTAFAEGLRLPTGIMRWKKGVIVTDSPDVVYLEDSDGDGRADIKRVMLTGFALTNPQHTTNSPLYGLDNWIYLANEGPVRTIRYGELFGDEGSPVHFPDRPDVPRLPPDADGRNVRFRPDTYELEGLSARSQFGHTFDAWGHHFLNTNNRHIYQEVIAARYLARNPSLVVPTVVEQLPDYRMPAAVFPITEKPQFELLTDVGVMTSACGLTYYLAELFPPAYRRAAFVAEGAHNIVHVAAVRDHGVTFRASRMHDGREFLASTDSWFRPVNFYIGPDGALYLVDYYRRFFEHPEWMDEATAKSTDLYEGKDRGRIYRIVPRGTTAASWADRVRLGDAPVDELVRRLGDANIWWRRTAQRLLVDRRPRDAAALLTGMSIGGESAAGRVHALWTLEGIGQLPRETIERALQDPVAGVRENAIRIAEIRLKTDAGMGALLLAMREERDPKVRFQLLLTLGYLDSVEARDLRNRFLIEHVEDEWMQAAALSAARLSAADLFRTLLARLTDRDTPGRRTLFTRIGATIGAAGDIPGTREILRQVTKIAGSESSWWRAATLDGLATGLNATAKRSEELDSEREQLTMMALGAETAVLRRAALHLLESLGLPRGRRPTAVLQEAEQLAADDSADADARADALRLLALGDVSRYESLLRGLLSRAAPVPVQVAAVRMLGSVKGDRTGSILLELWDRWTPAVRDEAVRALVREPARIRLLLDAVAAGRIRPTEIDRPLRIRLMMLSEDELRLRARALFGESATAEKEAVSRYAKAASLRGDRVRGRRVFARACATCHQYRSTAGAVYGPDLGEVRNRLPMALLSDILHPNQSIADGYELWLVQLVDGGALGGVIGAETQTSITFRLPGGAETTVARSRIASMRIADVSAMPEGLDAQITVQQMADLIAFIKGG